MYKLLIQLLFVFTQATALHAAELSQNSTNNPKQAIEKSGIVQKGSLMWMRCSLGQTWTGTTCTGEPNSYTWHEAMALKQSFAGYKDWRLPTNKELISIRYCSTGVVNKKNWSDGTPYSECDENSTSPTIDIHDFPNTPGFPITFWSSSEDLHNTYYAHHVYFGSGNANSNSKNNGKAVRLVRSK